MIKEFNSYSDSTKTAIVFVFLILCATLVGTLAICRYWSFHSSLRDRGVIYEPGNRPWEEGVYRSIDQITKDGR